MKILYRYLLQRLLIYFFIVLPAFSIIVLLAEIVEILRKIKVLDVKLLTLYLLYQLPEKIYYVLPVSVVIALILLARELIDRREIYPILLNGISLKRLAVVLLSFPLFLSFVQFINIEYVMPETSRKAKIIYEKLKASKSPEDKFVIGYDKWISTKSNQFIYFGFIDLNKGEGKNIILLKFRENFQPLERIEAEKFKIRDSKLSLFNVKFIDFKNLDKYDMEISYFKNREINLPFNIENLKDLFRIEKPIAPSEFYKSAKVFEKFGYSADFYWGKFYSIIATIFSPFILAFITYPFLWSKKKDRIALAFGLIVFYWYATAFLTSLVQTGQFPYIIVFSIDIIYLLIGAYFMKKLEFVEV
jgi:lipopolysaccharide export LptBFGC system permease protein LptF